MKLIDKDALVAEIESKFQKYWKMGEDSDALQDGNAKYWGGVLSCINEVKTLINTIEVKEVDLDRKMQAFALLYLEPLKISDSNIGISITMAQLYSCAKHFFELGLKAQKGEEV